MRPLTFAEHWIKEGDSALTKEMPVYTLEFNLGDFYYRNMNRLLVLCLILAVVVLILTACGGNSEPESNAVRSRSSSSGGESQAPANASNSPEIAPVGNAEDVGRVLAEYGRAFIGNFDPEIQEKIAYKNAETLIANNKD